MRRILGTVPTLALAGVLALGLGLTGCGDDDAGPTASDPVGTTSSGPATDPATDPAIDPATDFGADPTKAPPGGVTFDLVEIVSGTAGRGTVSDQAVELASDADVDAFVAAFSDDLAADVREAAGSRTLAPGLTLYAAVVGLGCDVPPGVAVTADGGGYRITGTKVADPIPECFAPVTSVALVAIPD